MQDEDWMQVQGDIKVPYLEIARSANQLSDTAALGWACDNAASALQDMAGLLQTGQLISQGMTGGMIGMIRVQAESAPCVLCNLAPGQML